MKTTRITPQVKAIADAHITARLTNSFDNPNANSNAELLSALMDGKTHEKVLDQIELRFCSITSILLGRQLGVACDSYRKSVYKGFKLILQ